MPDLTIEERLQPSLLDRLTDDEPHSTVESRLKRAVSNEQLRASVVRDLAWLLNTQNMEGSEEFEGCSLAQHSVINFGIPPLSGSTASGVDMDGLIKRLREAIRNYEPRLIADSVRVTASSDDIDNCPNTLNFYIEAELWTQPLPLHLFLVTSVDLETGHIELNEADD